MQTDLRGRDLISLQEWTKEEIDTVLEVAARLKLDRALGRPHKYLEDKVLAMLFFFSSTRTRASFEAGMAQLGGHAQFIESRTTQIAHGDTAREIGEILGRYNDGIAIRNVDWGVGNQYIRDVAEASRVPVLNMQCDLFHPHQFLADLLTIQEKKGDLRGRTLTVSWAYAASYQKPMSVPIDLALAGDPVRDERPAGPPARVPAGPGVRRPGRRERAAVGRQLRADGRLRRRLPGAPTSSTPRAGVRCSSPRTTRRARRSARTYTDWITDERRMALAAEDSIYMHPLPADRNVEVAGCRHRRSALGRLRRGREPAPRPEGGDGADDALKAGTARQRFGLGRRSRPRVS